MANRLVLRSKNSPFTGQFTDINLGSVLSHTNLDDNFIYLKGNLIYSASTNSNILELHKIDGSSLSVELSGKFTGNTSATCIDDIFISNLNGCDDNIQVNNNLKFQEISIELGPLVTFTKTNFGSERDIISSGTTEITRGNSQGIFNIAQEGSYNNNVSPVNTEWNSLHTDGTLYGWSDLTNVRNRVFSSWEQAVDGNPPSSVNSLELIMHDLSTDRYYKIMFTQWTPSAGGGGFSYERQEVLISENNKITFSDGLIQDSAAHLISGGTNITITESIINDKPYYIIDSASGGVPYSNVLFVDATFGDNATAQIGEMSKPWATIYDAMDYADSTGSYNEFNRALVYVRAGSYGGIYNLRNYVDVYCEPNVILYSDFRDNTQAINANIYGYAKFRGGRGLLLNGNSNVYLEFDNAEVSGAFLIASPPTGSTLTVKGNYIKADGLGTAYGNSIRGKANVNMYLSQHGTSLQTFMDIRNSYSGKLRIKAPEIHLAAGDNYGIDFKQCVFVRGCNGADVKIEAKLINDVTGYDTMYGLFTAVNVINSKFELIGDIESLDGRAINFIGTDSMSRMRYTGNITTSNETIQINGQGRVFLDNVKIVQTGDTGYHVITLTDSIMLQCNDTTIQYQSTSGNTFNSLSDTNTCVLMNVKVYNETNSGYFANGAASWSININNSISNIDINSATVTNTSSPSGFNFDTNFYMLYF